MLENPFTPGYGESPPYLAGRIDLVHEIIAEIRRGPGRSDFHHVLVGPRGTGKTSTITRVAAQLESEHDGLTMRWTAGSRPLTDAVSHSAADVDEALTARINRKRRDVDATINLGIPGATATATSKSRAGPEVSTFRTIQQLARKASKKKRTILFWIDEAQRASPSEVATLAGIMQELANVEGLPIAICAAGLPDTRANWIDGASSLERQEFLTLGNLDEHDTAAAIEIPVHEAGRTIEPDALDLLVQASKGFPYAIQLMAARAWGRAGEHPTITSGHAVPAVRDAIEQLREQLYESRYRQMPAGIRDYVHAAAALRLEQGSVKSNAVAQRLGLSTQQASTRRDELINDYQVLVSPRRNELEFTTPGFAEWINQLQTPPARTTIAADDTVDQLFRGDFGEDSV